MMTPCEQRPRKTRLSFGSENSCAASPAGGMPPQSTGYGPMRSGHADDTMRRAVDERTSLAGRIFGGIADPEEEEEFDGGAMGEMPEMPTMGPQAAAGGDAPGGRQPGNGGANVQPDEQRGWERIKKLGATVQAMLTGIKRPGKTQQDSYIETQPISERYRWMACGTPASEGDRTQTFSDAEMGRYAAMFSERAFERAGAEIAGRILETVRVSQAPTKRMAALLATYGIHLSGLPTMHRALVALAVAVAEDQLKNAHGSRLCDTQAASVQANAARAARVAEETARATATPVGEGV